MIRELEAHLRRAIRKHNVPGASVALLKGRRFVAKAAAGVTNRDTGVKATTDSLFQIGSITKPFTATMIMQLRDEGRLSLDDPVLKFLPNFRNADMERLQRVTLRHLLTHQSGIDGDFFPKTDAGDSSVERLLEMAAMLQSLFEPGTNFSYCNIGFAMLGRVIEVLDNRSYDDSLKARLFDPLEMTHAYSRPEDAIRFRVAVGHIPDPKSPRKSLVAESPYLCIGQKAAGSTPTMTATDLLKFAGAHLHNGMARNGTRILKAPTAREMLRPQFRAADRDAQLCVGLAWGLSDWNGDKVFLHEGSTVGQTALLLICKEKNIAVAALANGGNAMGLFAEIVGGVLKSSAGITMMELPKPCGDVRLQPSELTGRYKNIAATLEVSHDDNGALKAAEVGILDSKTTLKFVNPRLAVTPLVTIEFGGPRGKPAEWLRTGGRLFPRCA
jgi:CubicO group peptidase (beta-lactamase class C family)